MVLNVVLAIYLCTALNYTFRCMIRLPNLFSVATPQDNIIEVLEAEVIKLKTPLIHTEVRLSELQKKFDELRVILRET